MRTGVNDDHNESMVRAFATVRERERGDEIA
jgi:hypothetical protein